jgi:hypothetical protein
MGTILGIFIIFIIIIVLAIVIKSVSNTNKNGIEYNVPKKLITTYNPKIGDDVKFWLNPRNNKIQIYVKGSSGGDGKIGEIHSIPDAKKLENDELHAVINNITENSIFIKFY